MLQNWRLTAFFTSTVPEIHLYMSLEGREWKSKGRNGKYATISVIIIIMNKFPETQEDDSPLVYTKLYLRNGVKSRI